MVFQKTSDTVQHRRYVKKMNFPARAWGMFLQWIKITTWLKCKGNLFEEPS